MSVTTGPRQRVTSPQYKPASPNVDIKLDRFLRTKMDFRPRSGHQTTICRWAWANRSDDSRCKLLLTKRQRDAVISFHLAHSDFPTDAQLAVIPNHVADDARQLTAVVKEVFRRNGDESEGVYLFKGPPDEFHAGSALSSRRLKSVVRESGVIQDAVLSFDRWWVANRKAQLRPRKFRLRRPNPEPRQSIFDSDPQERKDRSIAALLQRVDATASERPTGTVRIRRGELMRQVRAWMHLGPWGSRRPGDEHSRQLSALLRGRAREVLAVLRLREDRMSREALYRIAELAIHQLPRGYPVWAMAKGTHGWLQIELWGALIST